MTGSVSTPAEDAFCSIERTAAIIGDRWSFLILRQALIEGVTRFADLQTSLGIAPNVLTNRLGVLVDAGVLVKREYKEPGARPRQSYHQTSAAWQLKVVLGAMQQWGDEHVPPRDGVTLRRRSLSGDRELHVGFVDDPADLVPLEDVDFE